MQYLPIIPEYARSTLNVHILGTANHIGFKLAGILKAFITLKIKIIKGPYSLRGGIFKKIRLKFIDFTIHSGRIGQKEQVASCRMGIYCRRTYTAISITSFENYPFKDFNLLA